MARTTEGRMFKRGKTWHLQWYVNGKEYRRSLHKTIKDEAIVEAAKLLAPVKARQSAADLRAIADAKDGEAARLEDEQRDKLAVADAWELFEAARNRGQCSAITLADYARRWQVFADWMEAQRPKATMEATTPADADAFARALDESKLSANRRNKIIQTARLVFNTLAAKCNGMANPFGATAKAGVRNQQQRTSGRRALAEGELRQICASAEGELRLLLALGIYCGMRLKDAALLQWHDVDLEAGRLTFTPSKTARLGKVLTIPLHPELAALLAETPPADRRDDVIPEIAAMYRRDVAAVSKLVTAHFRQCDIATQADAGTMHKRAAVSYHSLRHSFVSLAAKAGIPLAIVREIVGHGSPEIQRHYLHFDEADARRAVMALPSFTRPANGPTEAVQRPLSDAEALAAIRARLTADDVPEAVKRDVLAMFPTPAN